MDAVSQTQDIPVGVITDMCTLDSALTNGVIHMITQVDSTTGAFRIFTNTQGVTGTSVDTGFKYSMSDEQRTYSGTKNDQIDDYWKVIKANELGAILLGDDLYFHFHFDTVNGVSGSGFECR